MKNNAKTNIIVIVKDQNQATHISNGLKSHGHNVSACLGDIELVKQLRLGQTPLAVVVDDELLRGAPNRVTSALAAAAVILMAKPNRAQDAIKRATIPIDALVLRPVDIRHLAMAIDLAVQNRQRLAVLANDCAEKHAELEQRKVVERAKGIMMNEMGWDPKQAEDYLRRQAQELGVSLGQAAQAYIDSPVMGNKAS